MMDWLVRGRFRLPALLGVYFAAHVLVRATMSTSLDFDESEQVLLSQFWMLGYNSQPPLYTWIQSGLFDVLGYSVFSLALLKNVFIWLTYWFVFEAIRKATGSLALAAVSTLGMLTIPQIAWESHRDLSHTVAATFATTLLCYGVISLAQDARSSGGLRWYALIGFAVGFGDPVQIQLCNRGCGIRGFGAHHSQVSPTIARSKDVGWSAGRRGHADPPRRLDDRSPNFGIRQDSQDAHNRPVGVLG